MRGVGVVGARVLCGPHNTLTHFGEIPQTVDGPPCYGENGDRCDARYVAGIAVITN